MVGARGRCRRLQRPSKRSGTGFHPAGNGAGSGVWLPRTVGHSLRRRHGFRTPGCAACPAALSHETAFHREPAARKRPRKRLTHRGAVWPATPSAQTRGFPPAPELQSPSKGPLKATPQQRIPHLPCGSQDDRHFSRRKHVPPPFAGDRWKTLSGRHRSPAGIPSTPQKEAPAPEGSKRLPSAPTTGLSLFRERAGFRAANRWRCPQGSPAGFLLLDGPAGHPPSTFQRPKGYPAKPPQRAATGKPRRRDAYSNPAFCPPSADSEFTATSVNVASIKSKTPAIETAFSNATRTTFVGSIIPALMRSRYSPLAASNP